MEKVFAIQVDQDVKITGRVTLNSSKFIDMPRGRIEMEMLGASRLGIDEHIPYEGLIFKVHKSLSKQVGDSLMYLLHHSEKEKTKLLFDTYYFDDRVKFQVYHKNSAIKPHSVGKGVINLKDLDFT